jgi:hypothetical protein
MVQETAWKAVWTCTAYHAIAGKNNLGRVPWVIEMPRPLWNRSSLDGTGDFKKPAF